EAMACYDLTRLRIAQRILMLEGKSEETTASAFVPEFLPQPVRDPFDGNTYRWDTTSRQFYSVGPDGDDDLLKKENHSSDISAPGNGDLAIPGEMPPHPNSGGI